MELDYNSYNQLRSKELGNQPLRDEEQKKLDEFEAKYKDALNPELSVSDIIAGLRYEQKTASSQEFYAKIKDKIALEQAINRFNELKARRPVPVRRKARRLKILELSATLASAVITLWLALLLHQHELLFPHSKQEKINTKNQESIKQVLADGSSIILNAASSLSYPGLAASDSRKIALSGEAYFEVSPVPGKPFIVSAQNLQLKAAAAKFNICAYPDGTTTTTVVEGAVRVCLDTMQKIVHAGEQAVVTDRFISISKYPAANELVAWKDNRFFFTLQPVSDIMVSLERWYGVSIQFQNKDNFSSVRHTLDETKDLPVSKVLGRLEKNKVLTFFPKKKNYEKGDTIWITHYDYNLNGQTAGY